MADREESTAAPSDPPDSPPSHLDAWEELSPLRETFLHYVGEPEPIAALRAVARFFFTAVLEFRAFPEDHQPLILMELSAVAKDARYLAGFLHHNVAADDRGTMEDRRRERWLQVRAEEWADTLSEVAAEIEGAIAE